MKFIVSFCLIFSCINSQNLYAQKEDLNYLISLNTGFASKSTLPFWMVSNKNGALPNSDYVTINSSIYGNFKKTYRDFGMAFKISTSGIIANSNNFEINEAYLRLQFKNWALDLGSINDKDLWKGLSSSNGNIVKSINARALPGVNFKSMGFTQLPFAKNWLKMKFSFGNYFFNDKRYVKNSYLHSKSIQFKFRTGTKFSLVAGLDHYAEWGGTSPNYGKQPSSFSDFVRVVIGKSGDSNSTEGDQINALGSSLGSYLLQLNYSGYKTDWNFYYSHLFEDRSGREMMNYPDALYGLFIDFKRENSLLENILAECTYTKNASGTGPHYTDDLGVTHAGSGMDDYFNNWVYLSGWTYYGRTIGSPYFTTVPVDENGITQGIIKGDNRFMAFNIGLGGSLNRFKYKALISHITYFGWFDEEYTIKPKQLSGLLEVAVPNSKLPFEVECGFSFDTGTYRPVNFGGFLKLSKRGVF